MAIPSQPGDLTYLHEKLGQAIHSAMFAGDAKQIAGVFEILSRGINDVLSKGEVPYLENEEARDWLTKIQEMITPSEADRNDPLVPNRAGAYEVRAERMTVDNKLDLARCMWELFCHVNRHGRD